jgi:CheY-like chemotaxis protein
MMDAGDHGSMSPEGDPGEKPRIAVIDDEQRWLKVFKRMFRSSNYAVDTFDDPEAFLAALGSDPRRFAGIICDINMPQMDGHAVLKTVKENPATRNIPFLIVSGALTYGDNLARLRSVACVSKLTDDLRSVVFSELIEVIENWPLVRSHLIRAHIPEEKIEFFREFFINYHHFFGEILTYVNQMETACVRGDREAIVSIRALCDRYMNELQDTCMQLIEIVQEIPAATRFIGKVCERGRNSLNMIQGIQCMLSEEPPSSQAFNTFLIDCRDSLERIVAGTENGYNLRSAE